MKFKITLLTAFLTGLFILGGCRCSCTKTSCPMPQEVTSASLEVDSAVQ